MKYSSEGRDTPRNRSRFEAGLGLMEFVVGVLIVGVITLVAVPFIKNTTAKATEGKAMANAHTICNLYNGARSVGVVFSSPTKAGIVQELFAGVSAPDLKDSFFQMPELSGPDLVEALRYCRYDPVDDSMAYQSDGSEMLEVVVVQAGSAVPVPVAATLEEDENNVATTPGGTQPNDAKWTRFPSWFTSDPQQAKRVLEYIRSNPRMVHFGVEFGAHEWRSEQSERGLWWPEFRTK